MFTARPHGLLLVAFLIGWCVCFGGMEASPVCATVYGGGPFDRGVYNAGTTPTPVVTPVPTVASSASSGQQSVTLFAIADTYTVPAEPTKSHGSLSVFKSDGDPYEIGYVMFDGSSIPWSSVVSLQLRLHVSSNASAGPQFVQPVTSNWSEVGLTEQNKPQPLDPPLGRIDGTQINSWIQIPLNLQVLVENGQVSFAIVPMIDDAVFFDSREAGFAPQLIIVYNKTSSTQSVVANQTIEPVSSPSATLVQTSSASATPLTGKSQEIKPDSDSGSSNVVAQAVSSVASAVGKTVADSAKSNTAAVIAPLSVAAAAAVPAVGTAAATLPFLNFWHLPAALASLLRRKNNPWGVVYDSATKQPLDPVVVTLANQNGKSSQAISDIYGRYEFLAEPGVYTLTAQKSHYAFPSKQIENDPVYDNVYRGQPFKVEESTAITFNIPMDPLESDWNEQEKHRMKLRQFNVPRIIFVLSRVIFFGGLLWSLVAAYIAPTFVNSLVICIYAVFFVATSLSHLRHPWGVIKLDKRPVAGAVVRLVNPAFPQFKRPPVVTKESGRYSFLVDQGEYQLVVEKPDQTGQLREAYRSPRFVFKKRGHVSKDVLLSSQPNIEEMKLPVPDPSRAPMVPPQIK